MVSAVDAALPVPVAVAGAGETALTSIDNAPIDGRTVSTVRLLPRLGDHGTLVDLEYLERTALLPPRRAQGEVWLGPAAPADAAERLRKGGLAVSSMTGVEESRAALARQGPVLALQFHLAAAVFGIMLALGGLGLVAAVDRQQRAADFRALRRQGLGAATVRQASLWGYLAIVLLAAFTGLVGAMVAWLVAGDRLPVFSDALEQLTPPRWPSWGSVLLPWTLAGLSMVVGAVAAAWALRRSAARNNGKG